MEEKSSELFGISKAIEELTIQTAHNGTETSQLSNNSESSSSLSSSRGESDPQPFRKSIAEMEEEQRQPTISLKEFKALKRARYEETREKFRYAYVIRNKKTGLTVEVRAASSVHAAKIIGWRPRHTELLEVLDAQKGKENVEKVDTPEIKKDETIKDVTEEQSSGCSISTSS